MALVDKGEVRMRVSVVIIREENKFDKECVVTSKGERGLD